MDRCPAAEELRELLEGRLSEADRAPLARHVDDCGHCQQRLDQLTAAAASPTLVVRPPPASTPLPRPDFLRKLKQAGVPPLSVRPTVAAAWPAIPGYEIVDELGRGGMGVVYQARQRSLQRLVAVKVIDQHLAGKREVLERFEREMRVAARLAHPNLVAVHDAGQAEGVPFFIMEFVAGASLSQVVRQRGPLPVADACEVTRQAALGLQHIHEHGLVHRDVKPSNLLLTPAGQVKVVDLGLALLQSESGLGEVLTTPKQSIGTLDYMAPEQWNDSHQVDFRADIYSLGCTLYHVLAGRPPFTESRYGSLLKKMWAHGNESAPPIRESRPDVPVELAAVLERMLRKDPAQRYARPAEVAAALEPFAAGTRLPALLGRPAGPAVRGGPVPAPPVTRRPRRRLWVAAACVALALVGGVCGWLLGPGWGGSQAPSPGGGPAAHPGGPPIRVGVLHSLSGTMAISEKSVVDGTLLAIEEINQKGGLLGRPVEAVVADGRSDPATFAREAERLLTEEKVCTVFGCWTSASRKTVKPVFEKHDHLLIYPVQYEGLEASPNIVYTGAAPNQQIIPAVRWARAFLHQPKRFFLVGSDYVFPHTANAILRDELAELGGEVVGEEYLPLGSLDVAGVVQKIVQSKPDVILNAINGDSNVAFFRALRKAGLTPDRVPTISFSITEEELSNLGARDAAGDYAVWSYFQSINRPQNHAFVRRMQARYGAQRVTSDPVEAAYVGVYLWSQAVRKAGRDEAAAIRQAIKGQTFDAPEGAVRIDADNQHTWKTVRIGRVSDDGRFQVVYSSENPIRPEPYPPSRSRAEWDAFLAGLFQRWHGHWENPDS
jgi:urea transport system substrate-binding protein